MWGGVKKWFSFEGDGRVQTGMVIAPRRDMELDPISAGAEEESPPAPAIVLAVSSSPPPALDPPMQSMYPSLSQAEVVAMTPVKDAPPIEVGEEEEGLRESTNDERAVMMLAEKSFTLYNGARMFAGFTGIYAIAVIAAMYQ
jgi:hypothetical protein